MRMNIDRNDKMNGSMDRSQTNRSHYEDADL